VPVSWSALSCPCDGVGECSDAERSDKDERPEGRFIDTPRQRSYPVLIFSSLSRLAVMDSSTGLVPLIHAPPSRRRSPGKGP
jgi:hypothetical protein